MRRRNLILLPLIALFTYALPAHALITGGTTEKMQVRGLPKGSLALANLKTRIAWWEGPPFGGGQYHFEYQGQTSDLQKAIDLFSKIEAGNKRVVVRVGKKASFWLGIGDKSDESPVDWEFVVWVPENWKRLHQARIGLLPPGEGGESPRTEMLVHVTKRIDWEAIKVPDGVTVVDQRLEKLGLDAEDGAALKGRVTNAAGMPVAGAKISVGKDDATFVGNSDEKGEFLITSISAGTHRVLVEAADYASKDEYYRPFSTGNLLQIDVQMVKAANVRLRVFDPEGRRLSGVKIMVRNCVDRGGNHYRIAGERSFLTNDEGEIVLDDVPDGKIRLSVASTDYYYNSVANEHDTAESPIELHLKATGTVKIAVADASGLPVTSKYIVEIREQGVDPAEGGPPGSWGGSAQIGVDGTYTFKGVPAGKYTISGRPNPGRSADRTKGVEIEVKGFDNQQIGLTAK